MLLDDLVVTEEHVTIANEKGEPVEWIVCTTQFGFTSMIRYEAAPKSDNPNATMLALKEAAHESVKAKLVETLLAVLLPELEVGVVEGVTFMPNAKTMFLVAPPRMAREAYDLMLERATKTKKDNDVKSHMTTVELGEYKTNKTG